MAEKNFLYELAEKELSYPFDKKLLEKFLKCSTENNAKQLLKQVASLYQGDQVFYDVIEKKLVQFDNTAKQLLKDYKDHVIHSAYVFLTGIYLIEKISFLGKILKYPRHTFFKKWAIISIFHDAGYPTEIGADLMHDSVDSIFNLAFPSNNKPYKRTERKRRFSFSISQIERLFIIPPKFYKIFNKTNYSLLYTELPHFSRDTLKDFNDIDVLHLIAKYMANNLYSKGLSPIKIREIIINQFKANLAKGFIDHGLLSSVIFFQYAVKNFIKIYDDKQDVEGSFDKYLEENNLSFEDILSNISEVITAIYLHNSYRRLPDALRLDKFPPKPESCLTLFLIMLVDELQFWDRKRKSSQPEDVSSFKIKIEEIKDKDNEENNRILFEVISPDLKKYKEEVDDIAKIKENISEIFNDQIIVIHCIKKQSMDEFCSDTNIVKISISISIDKELKIQEIVEEYDFLKDIPLVLNSIKDHIYANKKGISLKEIEKVLSNPTKTKKEDNDNNKEIMKSILKEELIISSGAFKLMCNEESPEESLILNDMVWNSIKKIVTLLIGLKNVNK